MTSRNKFSALTWSSVAFAAVLVPTFAAAQDVAVAGDDRNVGVRERVKPEYEPLGIRAGAFMIRPQITAGVEYNDNVKATKTGEIDDVIYSITPQVDIRSDWSRNELGFRGKLTSWSYADVDSENRTDYTVSADGRIDLGSRSSLRATGGYAVEHESRLNAASPLAAIEPIEYETISGSIGATHEFNRLRLLGDINYRDYDFKDGTDILGGLIPQDVRDYQTTEYVGRAEYALSKGGVVFVEAGYNTRQYDNTIPDIIPVVQDSDGYRALIGTRIELSNLLRGEAAIGYLNQKYDDSRLKEASGLAARVDMQYFITGITTIGFGGSRDVQESGVYGATGISGGGVIATSVYGRVDHELLRNVILSGDVAYRDYDYNSFDRNDNVIEAGLGVDYLMNRVLSFGLGYRYQDRTSEGVDTSPLNEFTVNSVVLKATARF